MKKLFEMHSQAILIGLAFLLLAVLGTYFFWGGRIILTGLHESLKIPSVSEKPIGFDIEAAKALNLKLE
ncbi:MAG: hypothetical protein A3B25_02730 [Candidatus Ryanbacteria bacterium RIFCSPLOWO2_01_FULL_48_26]|uniref:Uncharacterized protein n=1 Tax=Candidatus Ryanbacteria bacterium RIFCSPLOWO2_01_FULL_48_26 TaxID=1802126 RepID=A0A1G2GVJ4_9BACT|nr:MAG: hypothetical protein A3B25_02730 [Candidatus Ryanbacteria bacterium RIFCSPLOWO2_01_FULL_48_26]